MIFGRKLLSLFSINFNNLLFLQVHTVAEQWYIHNPSMDHLGATHFLTRRDPCLDFDPYHGNHWARSTDQPLC